MTKEFWEIYYTDMDGRRVSDEIITIVEIEYDETDKKWLLETWDHSWVPSSSARSHEALRVGAEKMGWKNQYWMNRSADEISLEKIRERIETIKSEVKRLHKEVKRLEVMKSEMST